MQQNLRILGVIFIVLLFFPPISLIANSQENLKAIPNQHYQHFTQIDGLPSTEIYDITQDNQGFLWFATDCGLARYDGEEFNVFEQKDGLPDDVILNFFEQKDGSIWCSTLSKNIFYFKNATDGFHNYPFNDIIIKNVEKRRVINNISLSQSGSLYLTFVNGLGYLELNKEGKVINNLLDSLDDQEFRSIEFINDFLYLQPKNEIENDESNVKFSNSFFKTLKAFNLRCLWYPNQKRYVLGIGRLIFICDENFNILTKKIFDKTSIYCDKYDTTSFWVGFQYGGASQYDLDGNLCASFLPGESVTKIFFDHEGGKWYSTLSSGLFYNSAPKIKHYTFESYPLELTHIRDDSLFISFHNGDVLIKKDSQRFEYFYQSSQNQPSFVNYYAKFNVLIYGDSGLSYDFSKARKQVYPVSIYPYFRNCSDDLNQPPALFLNSSVYFPTKNKIDRVEIGCNIRDVTITDKGVFISTVDGLYKFLDNKVTPVIPRNKLLRKRISDLDYKYETLYMATFGGGLVVMKADTIFSINQSNGLLSNRCNEVYIENEYTIWVGTNKGLSRVILYPNNKFDVQSLSIKNGLNCTEINDIEIINDQIWITAKEGLLNFKKTFLAESIKDVPKWLNIFEIKVNGRTVPKTKGGIELTPNEREISFKFGSISFKNSEKPLYRYRLKGSGLSDSWTETTANSVNFSQLPSGNYQFELSVKGESGNWIEYQSISLFLSPPFWKTWWFVMVLFLTTALVIFLAFKLKLLTFNFARAKLLFKYLKTNTKRKPQQNKPSYVKFKSSGEYIKIDTEEIIYFKSAGNYVEIHTNEMRYTVRATLSEIYNNLPDKSDFVQLHRSYFVAKQKVTKIASKVVFVGDIEIPVSRTYAKNLSHIKF